MNGKHVLAGSLFLITTLMSVLQRGTTAWVRQPVPSIDSTNGKIVFVAKCEPCHFDLSTKKKIGPGLAGLMKHERFKNGMPADDYHLRRVIERGGKDMPPFRSSLTRKQIRDLIAYLNSL